MPNDWKAVELGDFGEFRNGVNFNREQEGIGLPVLKVKDFGDLVLCPLDGLDELDAAGFKLPPDQLLANDDIVIIRSNGNPTLVGRSVLVQNIRKPTTFSGFCIRFRPDASRLDPRFAAYVLRSPNTRDRMTRFGSGTGIQNLNQSILAGLPVDLPELGEQRAIAAVLGALDDKIEQNRRTGRSLDELARATFKAWFVDFEPIKAKAAGQRSFPGVSPAAFAALPDRLTDSSLGPVPEGWRVASLPQLATFLNGLALQKYPARGDGSDLPVIKIAELRKESSANADAANADVPGQYIIDDGDLLFSWSGTLEVKRWFGGKGALNQHLFKVTPGRHPLWFVHHAILYHLPDFRAIASSKATTMGHIQRKHLDAALVVVPPESVLGIVDESLGPSYNLAARLKVESRSLATLRDYLLPKLLSGEVRVQPREGTHGV